jgi:hypothetical protein
MMIMDDKMAAVIEAGMVSRRMDIDLGRRLERERILVMLRAFISDDGLLCSDGDVIYYAEGDLRGVRRAIELIEGEE